MFSCGWAASIHQCLIGQRLTSGVPMAPPGSTPRMSLRNLQKALARAEIVMSLPDPERTQLWPIGGDDFEDWGSDYPHSESTFPQSRKILQRGQDRRRQHRSRVQIWHGEADRFPMMFGAGLARLLPDLEGTATGATAVGCRLVTASKQLFAKRLFHGR
jgi:hypothetical protein